MLNDYLSVLYKHIIQVENENVGLKVCEWGGGGGTNIPLPPNQKSVWGGAHKPLAPPPPPLHLATVSTYMVDRMHHNSYMISYHQLAKPCW